MKNLTLTLFLLSFEAALGQPFTKNFIMAFHTCDAACTGFSQHYTHLAESNDGTTWTAVPGFVPYLGSVPDVIVRGSKVYIYNPGKVKRYNDATGSWEPQASVSVLDSLGNPTSFVDPSPILDASGKIVLFYLSSAGATGDPAACNPYPCTKYFDSAVEVDGSDGTQFIAQSGHRTSIDLNSAPQTASDPDIYFDGTRYIMYISKGSSTLALESGVLHGSYSSFAGLSNDLLTNEGGIPCGHFDPVTSKYWTFVHSNVSGNTVVRQGIHDGFSSLVTGFNTVISGPVLGEPSTTKTESPGFCENILSTRIPSNSKSNGLLIRKEGQGVWVTAHALRNEKEKNIQVFNITGALIFQTITRDKEYYLPIFHQGFFVVVVKEDGDFLVEKLVF